MTDKSIGSIVEDQQTNRPGFAYLRFGIPSLDELFGGRTGQSSSPGMDVSQANYRSSSTTICILGPDGTGKSVLALHLASRYATDCCETKPHVIYVSSDLSNERAAEIWRAFGLDYNNLREVPFSRPLRGSLGVPRQNPEVHADLLPLAPNEIATKLVPGDMDATAEDPPPSGPGMYPSLDTDAEIAPKLGHEDIGTVAETPPPSVPVKYLDLATHTSGDDWGFVHRIVSGLPEPKGNEPLHMMIIDAVEGLELLTGDRDAFGEPITRRGRIAQLARAAAGKCHLVFIVEALNAKSQPEQYVADVVIRLRNAKEGGYSRRTLEIEKARSMPHARGQHAYFIRDGRGSTTGLRENIDDPAAANGYVLVLPSLSLLSRWLMSGTVRRAVPDPPRDRCLGFGIEYLDEMLSGSVSYRQKLFQDRDGLRAGSQNLLFGDVQTYKSCLARAFLYRGFYHFADRLTQVAKGLIDVSKTGTQARVATLRVIAEGFLGARRRAIEAAIRSTDMTSACAEAEKSTTSGIQEAIKVTSVKLEGASVSGLWQGKSSPSVLLSAITNIFIDGETGGGTSGDATARLVLRHAKVNWNGPRAERALAEEISNHLNPFKSVEEFSIASPLLCRALLAVDAGKWRPKCDTESENWDKLLRLLECPHEDVDWKSLRGAIDTIRCSGFGQILNDVCQTSDRLQLGKIIHLWISDVPKVLLSQRSTPPNESDWKEIFSYLLITHSKYLPLELRDHIPEKTASCAKALTSGPSSDDETLATTLAYLLLAHQELALEAITNQQTNPGMTGDPLSTGEDAGDSLCRSLWNWLRNWHGLERQDCSLLDHPDRGKIHRILRRTFSGAAIADSEEELTPEGELAWTIYNASPGNHPYATQRDVLRCCVKFLASSKRGDESGGGRLMRAMLQSAVRQGTRTGRLTPEPGRLFSDAEMAARRSASDSCSGLKSWLTTLHLVEEDDLRRICNALLDPGDADRKIDDRHCSHVDRLIGRTQHLEWSERRDGTSEERAVYRASWLIETAMHLNSEDGPALLLTTNADSTDRLETDFIQLLKPLSDEVPNEWEAAWREVVLNHFRRWMICRRMEVHSANAPVIFHVLQRNLEVCQRIAVGHQYLEKDNAERAEQSWPIRVVIDDLTVLRDTFPEVERDSLFLPFVSAYLRREGVTALIIASQDGRPDTEPETGFDREVRLQFGRRQIRTWHVPFFGEHRVAISAGAHNRPEPALVRELMRRPGEVKPVVDPHFELYTGWEKGLPQPVPLEVRLYGETSRFSAHVARENTIFNDVFTSPLSPNGERRPVIVGVEGDDLERLRDFGQLRHDTRMMSTLVFQVDEHWALRRAGGLRPTWDYLNALCASNIPTVNQINDPFELFRGVAGDARRQTSPTAREVLRRRRGRFYWRGYVHDLASSRAGDQYETDAIDRVPYMWNFGFLMCDEDAWRNASALPLRRLNEAYPSRPDGETAGFSLEVDCLGHEAKAEICSVTIIPRRTIQISLNGETGELFDIQHAVTLGITPSRIDTADLKTGVRACDTTTSSPDVYFELRSYKRRVKRQVKILLKIPETPYVELMINPVGANVRWGSGNILLTGSPWVISVDVQNSRVEVRAHWGHRDSPENSGDARLRSLVGTRTVGDAWSAINEYSVRSEQPTEEIIDHGDLAIPPAPELTSWRVFLEACHMVASNETQHGVTMALPFDLALQANESFSSLVFEMWLSEIWASTLRHSTMSGERVRKHLRLWVDPLTKRRWQPSRQAGILGLLTAERACHGDERLGGFRGYSLELLKVFLLLRDVLSFESLFQTPRDRGLHHRPALAEAVATRQWYNTAADHQSALGPERNLRAVRLPGNFSTRGDWYLVTAKGSYSARLADRAFDLLNSRRANLSRLQEGLGLPVRDLLAKHPDEADKDRYLTALHHRGDDKNGQNRTQPMLYSDLRKVAPDTPSGGETIRERIDQGTPPERKSRIERDYFWFWRSSLGNYDSHCRIWQKWLARQLQWWNTLRHRQDTGWLGGFETYDRIELLQWSKGRGITDSAEFRDRMDAARAYLSGLQCINEFPRHCEYLEDELREATPLEEE